MPTLAVRGRIRFPKSARLLAQTRMFVRVLDVTTLDAPSPMVGEQILHEFASLANSGSAIEFEVSAKVEDLRNSYIVSVHVDTDGDGRVSRGDFLTMQSYPVLTRGNPDRVEVQVSLV